MCIRDRRLAKAGEIVGEGGALGVGSRPQSRTRQAIGHRALPYADEITTVRSKFKNRHTHFCTGRHGRNNTKIVQLAGK